ncbi:MAG: hypothetical protein KF861_03975 [Planctomycetaceae bacterium]|nr:hypothetical protein [Planctomycetaceae bacterium]
MSILVMSMGLLSVMSLFPIAFLRSAQGTQLTNAAVLKAQAEILVDLLNLTSDDFIPQPVNGATTRCVIDPLGFQDRNTVVYGVQGAGPPFTPYLGIDFGAQTPFLILPDGTVESDGPPNFPTTPLRRLGLGALAPLASNNPRAPYPASPNIFANRAQALSFVALPDQYDTLFSAIPAGLNAARTQVTFSPQTIASDALTSLATITAPLRVVLIHADGKRSQVRTPTAIGAASIEWAAPLPVSFALLSEVRIETQDLRYTWMLTVRKRGTSGGSVSEIDCAVFLNRTAANPADELVYDNPTNNLIASLPANVAAEDVGFTFEFSFTEALAPPLRKGSWVFDPTFARWYRVQDIPSKTSTFVRIRLDRRPAPNEPITTLVVPRGVVQVFPMNVRRSEGRRL